MKATIKLILVIRSMTHENSIFNIYRRESEWATAKDEWGWVKNVWNISHPLKSDICETCDWCAFMNRAEKNRRIRTNLNEYERALNLWYPLKHTFINYVKCYRWEENFLKLNFQCDKLGCYEILNRLKIRQSMDLIFDWTLNWKNFIAKKLIFLLKILVLKIKLIFLKVYSMINFLEYLSIL